MCRANPAIFGDAIGATGASAVFGNHPLVQICFFADGDWYTTQVNAPRVLPVSTRSPTTR